MNAETLDSFQFQQLEWSPFIPMIMLLTTCSRIHVKQFRALIGESFSLGFFFASAQFANICKQSLA